MQKAVAASKSRPSPKRKRGIRKSDIADDLFPF